jgi:hypothetical protein
MSTASAPSLPLLEGAQEAAARRKLAELGVSKATVTLNSESSPEQQAAQESRAGPDNTRLTEALDACTFGRVFPLSRAGKPKHKGWQRDATTDPKVIGSWRIAAYGIMPHPGSFVIDTDVKHGDGFASLAQYPELPTTDTTTTPSGGSHRRFLLPQRLAGYHVHGHTHVLPSVDVIGTGGSPQYVVGPGSVTIRGTYLRHPHPIAIAPDWFLELLEGQTLLCDNPACLSGAKSKSTKSAAGKVGADQPGRDLLTVHDQLDAACLARSGVKQGTGIKFLCPAHDDTKASAVWTKDKYNGAWHCFGCGASGGWLDLAQRLHVPVAGHALEARRIVAAWRERLATHAWSGTKGQTTWAIVNWILTDIERSGQRNRPLSVRHVAEQCGMTKKTVSRHLPNELPAGLLVQVHPARGTRAAMYRLRSCLPQTGLPGDTAQIYPPGTNLGSVPPVSHGHDLWRTHTGLGKGQERLYLALQTRALSRDDLRQLHPVARTVDRWVDRLRGVGLIVQSEDGKFTTTNRSPNEAVQGMRSEGRGAIQRRVHAAQRERWRWRFTTEAREGDVIDTVADEVLKEANKLPAIWWAVTVDCDGTTGVRAALAWFLAAQQAGTDREADAPPQLGVNGTPVLSRSRWRRPRPLNA